MSRPPPPHRLPNHLPNSHIRLGDEIPVVGFGIGSGEGGEAGLLVGADEMGGLLWRVDAGQRFAWIHGGFGSGIYLCSEVDGEGEDLVKLSRSRVNHGAHEERDIGKKQRV